MDFQPMRTSNEFLGLLNTETVVIINYDYLLLDFIL